MSKHPKFMIHLFLTPQMKTESSWLIAMCCISLHLHTVYWSLRFCLFTDCRNDTDLQLHRSCPENDQNFIAKWLNINNLNVHFCFAPDVTSTLAEKNHRSSHLSSGHLVALIHCFALVSIATHQSAV